MFRIINGTRQAQLVYLTPPGRVEVPAGREITLWGAAQVEFEAQHRPGVVLVEAGGKIPEGVLAFVEDGEADVEISAHPEPVREGHAKRVPLRRPSRARS